MPQAPQKSSTLTKFPYLRDALPTIPRSVDPFTVTATNGFMPLLHPLVDIPDVFKPVADLLERMPVLKADGSPGLLASYNLGSEVDKLPDLTKEIDKVMSEDGKPDLWVVTALFRDYSFLASAYILEPCWKNWNESPDKSYGLGRDRLPHAVAGPLYRCGQLLDIPPFMSYAASYALYNYKLADGTKGMEYSNLRLIRAFERGLDPKSSEAGFILTHIDMVKLTGGLVDAAVRALDSVEVSKNRAETNEALRDMLKVMKMIEGNMEEMWGKSKPLDYLTFRVFIFGITSQSMFPNGVVYEGIEDDQPLHFRGESGANDCIIPLLDHLCEIPMPMNPLTKVLHEFRAYRPLPQREFLAHVRTTAERVHTREFFSSDPETAYLYLRVLDHVRSFRWRHWMFTREYIIRRTHHPTATGGSPIVTWLPNQLFFVMDLMIETYEKHLAPHMDKGTDGKLDETFKAQVKETIEFVHDQKVKLNKEVEKWCKERGVNNAA